MNVKGYPPYAARHDETLCGTNAAWFVAQAEADSVYVADLALKGKHALKK